MKAVVLMATPCTKSLGGESGGHGQKWIACKHDQVITHAHTITHGQRPEREGGFY